MALPKSLFETEYGLMVQNDPEFDSIAASLLLVNSYNADQSLKLLWDYDQEDPLVDAEGSSWMMSTTSLTTRIIWRSTRSYRTARASMSTTLIGISTPECSNVLDLIRYEKAGERILNLSRLGANQLIPSGRTIIIYKNNSDQKGNSYGYHEKLFVRSTPRHFRPLPNGSLLFLVSRQIYCGAGKVGSENGAEHVPYQISQRADFFETEMGWIRW